MSLARLKVVSDYINENYSEYNLLDIGCRDGALSKLLKNCKKYTGGDITSGLDIIICDLNNSLSLPDSSYDIVCALDVLEHIDDIYFAASEIDRISNNLIIISLPNIAFWSFRINFLLKGFLSGKYKFHSKKVVDRHRWLTTYYESRAFIKENFHGEIKTIDILPTRGRCFYICGPIEKMLAKFFPNIFCYGTVFIISKKFNN